MVAKLEGKYITAKKTVYIYSDIIFFLVSKLLESIIYITFWQLITLLSNVYHKRFSKKYYVFFYVFRLDGTEGLYPNTLVPQIKVNFTFLHL